jgi:hypothetical protein
MKQTEYYKISNDELISKSIKKLLFKINKCMYKNDSEYEDHYTSLIEYIRHDISILKNLCEEEIKCYVESIKYNDINYLFENYGDLYIYLLNIKKINLFNDLFDMTVDENKIKNFCSQIKIYNEMFKVKKHKFQYNFEAMFELISGNEIYDEQMNRYTCIVSDHNKFIDLEPYTLENKKLTHTSDHIFEYVQEGGESYPLHHFMMAKGKSSTITPLLSLHFIINNGKKIFIIIPDHLVTQTDEIISGYIDVFNIKKYVMDTNKNDITIKEYEKIFHEYDILIFSDSKIKEFVPIFLIV